MKLTPDENLLLDALPTKMKADLAIHVHFNTLSKVQLFQVMLLPVFNKFLHFPSSSGWIYFRIVTKTYCLILF